MYPPVLSSVLVEERRRERWEVDKWQLEEGDGVLEKQRNFGTVQYVTKSKTVFTKYLSVEK